MDICILKSASRDLYFQQNLKLLRLMDEEDIALRYRTLWVEESLRDALSEGSHHTATIAFCDPPDYVCTPIRQVEIYNVDLTDESVTFFGRCGPFVDPQDSIDWAHQFKSAHPNAGKPPGKFIVDLGDQSQCPLARYTYQQTAWRAIIDELVKQPKYRDCFFFHNKGIVTAEGEPADPSRLMVGETYYLDVLSYNKHLPNEALASAQIRVITDDAVIEISSGICTVPPYKDFHIDLLPVFPGRSRVELCVAGSGVKTSRIKVEVECQELDSDSRDIPGKFATQTESEDVNWNCYRVARRLRPDDPDLLRGLLADCFTDAEQSTPKIAEEIVLTSYVCEDYEKCAEMLEQLDDQTIKTLSEDAQERLILAYCRVNSRFPTNESLSALDFTSLDRLSRLRDVINDLKSDSAASVVLSMISDYRNIHVDEHDLGELLTSDVVMTGFNHLRDIIRVVKWMQDCGITAAAYEFALNRLSCIKPRDDIELLQLCAAVGHDCGARELAHVVVSLAHRLLESNRPDEAMEVVSQYRDYISFEDQAYLVHSIADRLKDSCRQGWAYCQAAGLYLHLLDIEAANKCIYAATTIADKLGDENLTSAVQSESEKILEAEGDHGGLDKWDSVLSTVRIACRDKRIAVIGGYQQLPLLKDLEESVGCEIEWHASSLETHVDRASALLEGVRRGRTRVVVQLRHSGHADVNQIRSECKQAGVPLVFSRGTNLRTVVRAIASKVKEPQTE